MRRRPLPLLLAAAATLVAATATAAAAAAHEPTAQRKVERVVVAHGGPGAPGGSIKHLDPSQIEGDHLKIEDLSTLLPGETRSYTTEEGREVTVTRREGDRYSLTVAGNTVEIGDDAEHMPGASGEQRMIMMRREAENEGEGEEDVLIEKEIRKVPGAGDSTGEVATRPVVIEIVEESEGRSERRVLVLRVPAP